MMDIARLEDLLGRGTCSCYSVYNMCMEKQFNAIPRWHKFCADVVRWQIYAGMAFVAAFILIVALPMIINFTFFTVCWLIRTTCRIYAAFFRIPRRIFGRLYSEIQLGIGNVVIAEEAIPQAGTSLAGDRLEAFLPSSPLLNVNKIQAPKFVFKVMIQRPGTNVLVNSGMGAWVDKYFVTAKHVLLGADNSSRIRLVNVSDDTKEVDTVLSDWKEIVEEDVSYLSPTPQMISRLAIARASVGTFASKSVTVSVYARGSQSSGVLTMNHIDPVRSVVYKGSTVQGFSGSPYFAGNKVYGLHQASNLHHGTGMYMSYLVLMMDEAQDQKNESSEDYLIDGMLSLFKTTGKKVHRTVSPFDSDEYFLNYSGKVFRVDRVGISRLPKEMFIDMDKDSLLTRKAGHEYESNLQQIFADAEETPAYVQNLNVRMEALERQLLGKLQQLETALSKNLKSPAVSAAGVPSVSNAQKSESVVQLEPQMLPGPVKKESMVGQQSTLVQRSVVLPTTSESSKKRSRRRNPPKKIEPTPEGSS